jgi:hypothetical protein
MTQRLINACQVLASMQNPAVSELLRLRGFEKEARAVHAVVQELAALGNIQFHGSKPTMKKGRKNEEQQSPQEQQ